MSNLIGYAQTLVYTLMAILPSRYQRQSLKALLALFLEATGQATTEQSSLVSASALSRFLNRYSWSTRDVIRTVRREVVRQIHAQDRYSCRPILYLVIDLTTLEKIGKFKQLGGVVRRYNRKRGLHLVVLYLLVGQVRLPWGFRVYRGTDGRTPTELAQRLVLSLPRSLSRRYELRILADTAFGNMPLLTWVHRRKGLNAVVGVRSDRRMTNGQSVQSVRRQGTQVFLEGLKFPVTLSWYWFKRDDGTREQRFVVATEPLSGSYITRLGRKRWQIEGFFKVAKHRFSLQQFGQQSLLGVYRWIVLSWIAYFLAHCAALHLQQIHLPDWGAVAQFALELLLPEAVIAALVLTIKRYQPLARSLGIDLCVRGWSAG